MPHRVSRRSFLRHIGIGTGAMALSASGLNVKAVTRSGLNPEAPFKRFAAATTSFSYWTILNGNVAATLKNYNDMLCYQEYDKRTGVHIDFQHISDMGATQNEEQF